ncbi:MAG: hypothetical protein KME35_02305 [Aphanocapsa sp. GSE-SYN-MK-11-07L]|jgi:hypothetical protein|nr:hypothetical protein [Aphanocapsa sp. GSE-SYN-MK-11-07L]
MSLLDKIRQESVEPQVKVPPRTDPLTLSLEEKPQALALNSTNEDNWSASLEAELAAIPPISNKKVGVRLEEDILDKLDQLCRQHDVTIETLLEGFYTVCHTKDTIMLKVFQEAQNRIKRRTRAGNIRSVLTKSRNLQAKVKQ